MREAIIGFVSGVVLGFVFFAGLWLTVRHIPTSRRPGLLMAISLLLRLAVLLSGLSVTAAGGWPALVAALTGLILVRAVLIRCIGTPAYLSDELAGGIR